MDSLRDDTIWISAKAGPVLFGPSFLSPSLDISQALSCPIYVPCSGLLFSLFCASLFLCYVLCQTDRHWLKWDFADSSFGTGCTISSISQLNYMPLLAQWKSCVLQAVAHDYVNQCALVTSQARRCSGRPAAPGRLSTEVHYIHG